MGTVTIRDIPDDLCERVREMAAANRRSVNSEFIRQLEKSIMPHRINIEELLKEIGEFRASIRGGEFSPEDIKRLAEEGRS